MKVNFNITDHSFIYFLKYKSFQIILTRCIIKFHETDDTLIKLLIEWDIIYFLKVTTEICDSKQLDKKLFLNVNYFSALTTKKLVLLKFKLRWAYSLFVFIGNHI